MQKLLLIYGERMIVKGDYSRIWKERGSAYLKKVHEYLHEEAADHRNLSQ